VLHEQLRNAWHARKRVVPISPVLNLTPEGLVLGAGTVLVPADGPRRLKSLRGQEARVLALLSAAYGRAIAPSVLGNIERSAKAWSEGDDCLAYIHLAHAGLREPQDPYEAARRLFIVDGFMKAGTSPRAVFDALGLGATYIDAVEKTYNPAEPRVPAGSGSKSGQWTRELSFLAALPPAAVESLGGFVYALPNPEQNGAVVTYDDCQKTSGILFEIKGEEYAALLQIPQAEDSIRKQFSDQALRQVQASSGRPLVWIFAEPEAADFARELFNSNKDLERIFVVPMPWLKRKSR